MVLKSILLSVFLLALALQSCRSRAVSIVAEDGKDVDPRQENYNRYHVSRFADFVSEYRFVRSVEEYLRKPKSLSELNKIINLVGMSEFEDIVARSLYGTYGHTQLIAHLDQINELSRGGFDEYFQRNIDAYKIEFEPQFGPSEVERFKRLLLESSLGQERIEVELETQQAMMKAADSTFAIYGHRSTGLDELFKDPTVGRQAQMHYLRTKHRLEHLTEPQIQSAPKPKVELEKVSQILLKDAFSRMKARLIHFYKNRTGTFKWSASVRNLNNGREFHLRSYQDFANLVESFEIDHRFYFDLISSHGYRVDEVTGFKLFRETLDSTVSPRDFTYFSHPTKSRSENTEYINYDILLYDAILLGALEKNFIVNTGRYYQDFASGKAKSIDEIFELIDDAYDPFDIQKGWMDYLQFTLKNHPQFHNLPYEAPSAFEFPVEFIDAKGDTRYRLLTPHPAGMGREAKRIKREYLAYESEAQRKRNLANGYAQVGNFGSFLKDIGRALTSLFPTPTQDSKDKSKGERPMVPAADQITYGGLQKQPYEYQVINDSNTLLRVGTSADLAKLEAYPLSQSPAAFRTIRFSGAPMMSDAQYMPIALPHFARLDTFKLMSIETEAEVNPKVFYNNESDTYFLDLTELSGVPIEYELSYSYKPARSDKFLQSIDTNRLTLLIEKLESFGEKHLSKKLRLEMKNPVSGRQLEQWMQEATVYTLDAPPHFPMRESFDYDQLSALVRNGQFKMTCAGSACGLASFMSDLNTDPRFRVEPLVTYDIEAHEFHAQVGVFNDGLFEVYDATGTAMTIHRYFRHIKNNAARAVAQLMSQFQTLKRRSPDRSDVEILRTASSIEDPKSSETQDVEKLSKVPEIRAVLKVFDQNIILKNFALDTTIQDNIPRRMYQTIFILNDIVSKGESLEIALQRLEPLKLWTTPPRSMKQIFYQVSVYAKKTSQTLRVIDPVKDRNLAGHEYLTRDAVVQQMKEILGLLAFEIDRKVSACEAVQ